nr:alpha/beta fold hydrolase [uncultured Duncaniella sp.]
MKIILILVLLIQCVLPMRCAVKSVWQQDVLGDGYEMRYVDQGSDYSGAVVSTIVRKCVPDTSAERRRGVLYVHGFNDYFFNADMGDRFVAQGYDFYAVDLRKYGRSVMKGQRMFEMRDVSEYFADIDSALSVMRRSGVDEIALMGHSTGGLITACFMASNPGAKVDQFRRQADFKPVLLTVGIRVERIPAVSGFGVRVGNQLSGAVRLVPERAQSESGGRKISAVDFTGLFLKSFRQVRELQPDRKSVV